MLVKFVIEEINLDWRDGILSVQAVESFCQFHHPLSFPEVIDAGLRVAKIGNSSIVFEMALFGPNSQTAAANGHMVEVLVDRNTGKSRPISKDQRVCLKPLCKLSKHQKCTQLMSVLQLISQQNFWW